MSPPGVAPTTQNGITGTRTNAEIRRATATRFQAAARVMGLDPLTGWQLRSLMATQKADGDEPTDEDIIRKLMAAPWFPKRPIRKWRVGEGGGLALTSS